MLSARNGRRRRCADDTGSAMMLMPAGVLVILIMGAIAGDMSHVHAGQRDLIGLANSVAQDAVTFGIDRETLRNSNGKVFVFDHDLVFEAVTRSLTVHASPNRKIDPVTWADIVADNATHTVTVTLHGHVDYVFAKAIPGADKSALVKAIGIAVAEED